MSSLNCPPGGAYYVNPCLGTEPGGTDANCYVTEGQNPGPWVQPTVTYCSGSVDQEYICTAWNSTLITDKTSIATWANAETVAIGAPKLAYGPCFEWATNPEYLDNQAFQNEVYGAKQSFCLSDMSNPWCACMFPQSSSYAQQFNLIIGAIQSNVVTMDGQNVAEGDTQCWWWPCHLADLVQVLVPPLPQGYQCPSVMECVVTGNEVNITGSDDSTVLNFVADCESGTTGPGDNSETQLVQIVGYVIGGLVAFLVVVLVAALIYKAVRKKKRSSPGNLPSSGG